jgi:putative ABC transport system permease protein
MFRLALRNVFRHRFRTVVTLAAIVFGVVGLILSGGFVADIFIKLGEAVIHSQSGHLQIAKRGFQAEGTRKPDRYVIRDPESIKIQVASITGIADVMARTNFSGLLNNGRSDLAIVGEGIEAGKEARLGTHLMIVNGRRLAESDRGGVMVGEGVAHALGLAPGSRVTLIATTAAGSTSTLDLQVVGVFRTFSKDYDARAIKLPLKAAQQVLESDGVNTLVVLLERTNDTPAVAQLLRANLEQLGLEVSTWQELNDYYGKTVNLYQKQFGVLRVIVLLMVLLCVANSINLSTLERVVEFGTMRALGNRSRDVFWLILLEAVLLGIIGSLLGVVLAALIAWVVSAIGIPMPPPPNSDVGYIAQIQIEPRLLAEGFLVGLLAATFAGALSSRRISKVDIPDALRQGT